MASPAPPVQPARRTVSPVHVGREPELARLVSAATAPPALVMVEGEAGIGKSRLVTELRDRITGSGRRFVPGWCRRIREPFPLGAVIEAVQRAGDALAGAPLSPVAGALRPLLPELAELLPPQPPPLADRLAERHRVFRAVRSVLDSLGPAVLVLEDLHWADAQTIDFLSYLLADLPPALSLVVTFRGEEVDPAVPGLGARLPPSVTRVEQVLRPLDEDQTGALAAAILGDGQVSPALAGYLHQRTSGLPFAVEELLALLHARRVLDQRPGGWTRRAGDLPDVPAGIRDAVRERVRHLSAAARAVVEAAAVLQRPVQPPALAATCRVGEDRLLPALAEALDSGLLADDGDLVRFRHQLAAQAVYDSVPGIRRRQLHRRAAAAVAATTPSTLGELAHHLRRAGRTAEWVATAERAAARAVALGHDEEAARLLEEVLRYAQLDPGQRGRIAVALARVANETVHAGGAARLLRELPVPELPRPVRGELRFWLALLLQQTGAEPELPRRLCAEAVGDLAGRPDLQAWAMVILGIPAGAPGVPRSEHQRWLRRSLALLPALTDPALAVLLLGKAAMAQVAMGDPSWRQLTGRLRARTGGTPHRRREVSAFDSLGIEAGYAGHHDTAQELLRTALAGAAGCHSPRLELRSQA